MPRTFPPEISVPEAGKVLAVKAIVEEPTAMLLLGSPGIGKTVATKEAMNWASYLLLAAFREICNKIGPEEATKTPDFHILAQETRDAMTNSGYGKDTIDEVLEIFRAAIEEAHKFAESLCHFLNKRITNEDLKRTVFKGTSVARPAADLFPYDMWEVFPSTNPDAEEQAKRVVEAVREFLEGGENELGKRAYMKARYIPYAILARYLLGKLFGVPSLNSLAVYFDSKAPVPLYRGTFVYALFSIASVERTTVTGIPVVLSTAEGANVSPPGWAKALYLSAFGILNLDEVTNEMDAALKTAVYQITLERSVGTFKFGKYVVGTGNTAQVSSLVDELPTPVVMGRFEMYRARPGTVEDWANFMDRAYTVYKVENVKGNLEMRIKRRKWASSALTFLMFSKYSKAMQEILAEAKRKGEDAYKALEQIIEMINKLVHPADDIFMADFEKLASSGEGIDASAITPGEPMVPLPSPRSWTAATVEIYNLLEFYGLYSSPSPDAKAEAIDKAAKTLTAIMYLPEKVAKVLAEAIVNLEIMKSGKREKMEGDADEIVSDAVSEFAAALASSLSKSNTTDAASSVLMAMMRILQVVISAYKMVLSDKSREKALGLKIVSRIRDAEKLGTVVGDNEFYSLVRRKIEERLSGLKREINLPIDVIEAVTGSILMIVAEVIATRIIDVSVIEVASDAKAGRAKKKKSKRML